MERIHNGDPLISCGKLSEVLPAKPKTLADTSDKTLDILFKEAPTEIAVKIKTVTKQTDQINRIFFGDREILGNNRIVIIIKPNIFISNTLDLFFNRRSADKKTEKIQDFLMQEKLCFLALEVES